MSLSGECANLLAIGNTEEVDNKSDLGIHNVVSLCDHRSEDLLC